MIHNNNNYNNNNIYIQKQIILKFMMPTKEKTANKIYVTQQKEIETYLFI